MKMNYPYTARTQVSCQRIMAVVVPTPTTEVITKTCAAYDFTSIADVTTLVGGTWYGGYLTGVFSREAAT